MVSRSAASSSIVRVVALPAGHGAAVATRSVKDFQWFGVDIIDPWSA